MVSCYLFYRNSTIDRSDLLCFYNSAIFYCGLKILQVALVVFSFVFALVASIFPV